MMLPHLLRGGVSGHGRKAPGATGGEACEGLTGDTEPEAWSMSASHCSLVWRFEKQC